VIVLQTHEVTRRNVENVLRFSYPTPERDVILNAKIPARQSTNVVANSVIREGLFYAYVSLVEEQRDLRFVD